MTHVAVLGRGWSGKRLSAVAAARGWSTETLSLPRDTPARASALRTFARERTDVDVYVVTTPPSVQVLDATVLAEHGAHVLVEKPLGLDPGVITALRAVAGASKARVLVAYHLAVNPLVMMLRTPEVAASLGTIQHARFRMDVAHDRPAGGWLRETDQSGGVIVETLVHGFHLLDLIVGPIEAIEAAQEIEGVAATVLLRHRSGATSTIEGTWNGRAATRRGHVELFAAHGSAGFYRGGSSAYELRLDMAGLPLRSVVEHDDDVGFARLLGLVGSADPPTQALEDAVGLESAERALGAALAARASTTRRVHA